jgi:glycosyltransferase involved in cell wall biosynthesis
MRPRVVSVCLDLSPSHGGMYRAVTDLARTLESPIVTFHDGTGLEPPAVPDLPVAVVDWKLLPEVRRVFLPSAAVRHAATRAIGAADCIVVHSLFRSHTQIVRRAAHRRIPYIVVPHGALEPALWQTRTALRKAWMLAGGTRFLRAAARIVFATRGEQAHAAQTLGHEYPSAVIPFAVAAIDRPRSTADQAAARNKLALPIGRRLLLVLGRLDPVKRPEEIVAGFCAANSTGCDLVIAGMDGAVTATELRRLVPADMRDHVWLLGGLDSCGRDAALTACDGYLSWSRHESFGYAAAESLAAGLPVILPPGHGLRSALDGVACGLFPADGDRPALVAAIRAFAAWTEDEISNRGAVGREWVRRTLRPESVADQWRSLIADITTHQGNSP